MHHDDDVGVSETGGDVARFRAGDDLLPPGHALADVARLHVEAVAISVRARTGRRSSEWLRRIDAKRMGEIQRELDGRWGALPADAPPMLRQLVGGARDDAGAIRRFVAPGRVCVPRRTVVRPVARRRERRSSAHGSRGPPPDDPERPRSDDEDPPDVDEAAA